MSTELDDRVPQESNQSVFLSYSNISDVISPHGTALLTYYNSKAGENV